MAVEFAASASEFTFRIEKLMFNDGLILSLDQGATLIITGPNNGEKSITLREIQQHLQRSGTPGPPQSPFNWSPTSCLDAAERHTSLHTGYASDTPQSSKLPASNSSKLYPSSHRMASPWTGHWTRAAGFHP
jgi:hypothetical protein